jgi:glycosyltransferase involved in cell wall biosynthesis
VAVPGNFSAVKGADTICRVIEACRDEPIGFHVLGRLENSYAALLRRAAPGRVVTSGGYDPATIHQRLGETDVGLMLSLWPETYVLTLSECWRAGVVPIVTDVGALGERVGHGVNGLKVPVDEAGAVVHWLRRLAEEPELLASLRQNIHSGLYLKLPDHLRFLDELYTRLAERYRLGERGSRFYGEAPAVRSASTTTIYRRSPDWAGAGQAVGQLWWRRLANVPGYWRAHGLRNTLAYSWGVARQAVARRLGRG